MTAAIPPPNQPDWPALRRGDPAAFAALLRDHYRPLFNYGVRLMQDGDFVKDCIQDVFAEIWQRREQLGEILQIRYYLLKALRRRLFREQTRWLNRREDLNEPDESPYGFAVEFSIETQRIEQDIAEAQTLHLQRLLNDLPKRQREVLYLRFYQDLSYEQISEVMELRPQSVYNLVHEAIRRLRSQWPDEVIYLLLVFSEKIID
jgi:RNA polymerase sigma factor (sigma-70 family)